MAAPEGSTQYHPKARTKHVVVTVGNKMYVWGGWAGSDEYSHTLAAFVEIFDFTTGLWGCKQTKGIPPRGIIDSTHTSVGRTLYVFGGYDGMMSRQCTNELHQLDLNTFEWRKVVPQNYLNVVDNPRPMHGARMVAHRDSLLVMYGGLLSSGQSSGDLFTYDIQNG